MRRTSLVLGSALLAGLVLAPRGAFADDEPKPGQSQKVKVVIHKDGKHQETTLDPLDPVHLNDLTSMLVKGQIVQLEREKPPPNLMEIAYDLGIYTIIVFVLLFLILRKAAWGPMLEGLQKREDNIRSALEEAKKVRAEAEAVRTDLQTKLNNAAQEIREMMEEARRDAQHTRDEMVAAARADIQTERDRLHREIGTARDQALQELFHQSAQLATLISVKAVRKHLTQDDHRQLVDEALTELKTAGSQRYALG